MDGRPHGHLIDFDWSGQRVGRQIKVPIAIASWLGTRELAGGMYHGRPPSRKLKSPGRLPKPILFSQRDRPLNTTQRSRKSISQRVM